MNGADDAPERAHDRGVRGKGAPGAWARGATRGGVPGRHARPPLPGKGAELRSIGSSPETAVMLVNKPGRAPANPAGQAPGTAQRRAARAGSRAPRAWRGIAHRNGGEGYEGRPSSSPFIARRGRERCKRGHEGQERGAAGSPCPSSCSAHAPPLPAVSDPDLRGPRLCCSPPHTPPRRKLGAQLIESKARGKGPPRRGPPPPLLRAPFPALGGISSAGSTTSL